MLSKSDLPRPQPKYSTSDVPIEIEMIFHCTENYRYRRPRTSWTDEVFTRSENNGMTYVQQLFTTLIHSPLYPMQQTDPPTTTWQKTRKTTINSYHGVFSAAWFIKMDDPICQHWLVVDITDPTVSFPMSRQVVFTSEHKSHDYVRHIRVKSQAF